MGTSHTVSGRKVRETVGKTIHAIQAQQGALLNLHGRLEAVEGLIGGGFFARLRWLFRGAPVEQAAPKAEVKAEA